MAMTAFLINGLVTGRAHSRYGALTRAGDPGGYWFLWGAFALIDVVFFVIFICITTRDDGIV